MKLINIKKKPIIICAWCELEKTEKYEKNGFTTSHGICEKCAKIYF